MDGLIRNDLYKVLDGVIYYKDKIYLVLGLEMKKNIFEVSHDSPLARQLGYLNTYQKSREMFFWKGIKYNVLRHVGKCITLK